jgi:hypothetical protein
MSSEVLVKTILPRHQAVLWPLVTLPVSAGIVWALNTGGEALRWLGLGGLASAMALALVFSLEAGLMAMMLFEPLRGFLRRVQYLFLPYTQADPIHVVTPIVTIFALAILLRRRRFAIFSETPLAGVVSILAAIYFLEIFNPLQGGLFVGLSGALLMLVPVSWFYFGQVVSQKFVTVSFKIIVVLAMLTSLHGLYQLTFGYPRFEQYWLDHVEFYDAIAVGHTTRALATFSSAEEWGRYVVLGALIAFGFGFGAKRLRHRLGWFLCGGSLSAVLLVIGQRTANFGLILGFMILVLLGARSVQGVAGRLILMLLPVFLVAVLVKPPSSDDMWDKDETQTMAAVLSHTQRGTLQPGSEESLFVRLKIWQDLITDVIPFRPLGAGLGAGSLSESKFSDGPRLPNSDNFVLVVAVACGFPAALLFVWILGRSSLLAFRAARRSLPQTSEATITRIVAALMPVFVLNSFFGLTFTLYAVAPIAWLLIGWVSAEAGRARDSISLERQVSEI